MKKIEYFFDFLSPYSYLSWTWFREMTKELREKGYVIEFIPVSLAQVITSYETKGPAEIETKRNYLFKDCLRKSLKRNIPFALPRSLPFNSLYVLRMAIACEDERREELIDVFFRAGWEKGLELGSSESLEKILNDKGFPAQDLLDQVGSKDVRQQLKKNNQRALEKGVFGVPSFVVDKELFWGDDSKEFFLDYLKGKDQYNEDEYSYFANNYPILNN